MTNDVIDFPSKLYKNSQGKRELLSQYPAAFAPALDPKRYICLRGGRGGAKSHFFAEKLIKKAFALTTRWVCIREVQGSIRESVRQLLIDKINELQMRDAFTILDTEIRGSNGSLIIFKGMNSYNSTNIKSLEGYDGAWVEEAQDLSEISLQLLRPTIRKKNSELWFSYNPRSKSDPIDLFFMMNPPPPSEATILTVSWKDNPWFPEVLHTEMLRDYDNDATLAGHIWGGNYATALKGAYYASHLQKARDEDRICHLTLDPLMSTKAFFDIGGTGKKSDACAIWIAQFVAREIRILDYYEVLSQPLSAHTSWLRDHGYKKAEIFLPHDGSIADRVYDVTYESALTQAGFSVTVIKNQGAGAALMRVDALRRLFPNLWFNEATTRHGLDAVAWYHEKWDYKRGVGLGPDHDWSSHAADALGLLAVAYELPKPRGRKDKDLNLYRGEYAWLG
jgi:phage terminase large subunit